MTNTWADGLNPTFFRMSEEQTKLFMAAALLELRNVKEVPEVDKQFLIQVLNKRIEAMKLPITFSAPAKMAVLALTDRPGAVMELLIDCLNAFEGKEVTPELLSQLYPVGFYDEKTMERYCDNFIKPKKVKWAEIY